MALTGNGAKVAIYTDGEESSTDRREAASPSVVGNQLSGSFKLTLRGWETEVKTTLKSALFGQKTSRV